MCHKGHKIEEYPKNHSDKINVLQIMYQICLTTFFDIIQFYDLYGTFWPLKSRVLVSLPYFELDVV